MVDIFLSRCFFTGRLKLSALDSSVHCTYLTQNPWSTSKTSPKTWVSTLVSSDSSGVIKESICITGVTSSFCYPGPHLIRVLWVYCKSLLQKQTNSSDPKERLGGSRTNFGFSESLEWGSLQLRPPLSSFLLPVSAGTSLWQWFPWSATVK